MKNIIKCIFFFSLLLIPLTAYAFETKNIAPSIYFGFGNGTNIGGVIGIGTEVKFLKYFSANIAVGSIHPIFDRDVDKSKFDFDIGVKFYPFNYFFIGVNYGFIEYEYIRKSDETGLIFDEDTESYEETRGVSLTLGFRTPSYNNLYLSGYFGTTTDSDANCSDADGFLDESICMPRMGIMLGYEFFKQ